MKSFISLIIAGSRSFDDYQLLYSVMDELEDYFNISSVLSGTAKGADRIGESWANDSSIDMLRYPAKWDVYGKSAGPIRNREMAKNAEMLLAFWDGKSSGTKNMINEAIKQGLMVKVVFYEN